MKSGTVTAIAVLFGFALLAAPGAAQFTENFEGHAGLPTGVPNAGQNGWIVPAVANSIDGNCYSYAGNAFGFPPNPGGGGTNFLGNTNTGGAVNTRMEHVFGTPPYSGIWSAEWDMCADYLGTTFPAVNNIGSVSLQPSTTAKHFIALATWTPPVPTTSAPTTWNLDWIFFGGPTGLTQIQASVGNTALGYAAGLPSCMTNLRLRNWYRVKIWWDWNTNAVVRICLTCLHTGWKGYINLSPTSTTPWGLRGGLNNVGLATDPTNFRFFVGGTTAGNTLAYDNLTIGPDALPPLGNEYQVNQAGLATADINGVTGTSTCPAIFYSSFAAATQVNINLNGGAYDLAFDVGPAIPASSPGSITLPDGQIFSLNLATCQWLAPGGPFPAFSGPLTLSFAAPPPGIVVTAQVVAFGVGPLGLSLSQPVTLICEP